MDAIKEILDKWMPNGKITAAALGSAIAIIVLVILEPDWEQWQFMAVVAAAGIITGYLMPETLPWNKDSDG